MVFQGFSFFAMAIVSVGVIAYHFYKNREAYFYDNPAACNIYNPFSGELQCDPNSEDDTGLRKRKLGKLETCSICMDVVVGTTSLLPPTSTAVILPCKHVFHAECVKAWLNLNKTCPNCRAATV